MGWKAPEWLLQTPVGSTRSTNLHRQVRSGWVHWIAGFQGTSAGQGGQAGRRLCVMWAWGGGGVQLRLAGCVP